MKASKSKSRGRISGSHLVEVANSGDNRAARRAAIRLAKKKTKD